MWNIKSFFGMKPRQLGTLCIILFPVCILAASSFLTVSRTLSSAVKDRRITIAQLAQQNLNEQFNQLSNLNQCFAESATYRRHVTAKQWEEASSKLMSVSTDFTYIEGVFVTDESNVVQIDNGSGSEERGTSLGTRDWYLQATAKQKTSITNVYSTATNDEKQTHNAVAVISPIFSSEDKKTVVGWLGFRIPVQEISKTLNAVHIGSKGFVYITDAKGYLVRHPNRNPAINLVDFSNVPAVQLALRGETGVNELYSPIEKEKRLAAYIREPTTGWTVVVTQPSQEAYAERDGLQRFIISIYILIFLAIVIAVLIVLYLTRRLKRATLLSSQQSARNKAIFRSIGEGIIVVNEYGNIIDVNPAASQLLGFSEEELTGAWFPNAIRACDIDGVELPPEHRPILKTIERGKAVGARTNYVTKSGALLPVYVTAAPFLVNDHPVGAINVFHDRREEMKIERAKDEFVSIASHQLRTPLTAMRLFTEMLMEGQVGKLLPKQKNYLKKVEVSIERMIKLVADILNVSRIELGKLKVKPVPTDLVELIKSYIDEISPLAKEKKVVVNIKYPRKKWPKINLDPILMGQIIHNLLSNAVYYTNSEKGMVHVNLSCKADKVLLSVRDNGIGIPKEFKPRIFQRFGRADNAIAAEGQGTGLGLYLIKMIVDASGGEVSFKSKQNRGTTFYVTFPESGMTATVIDSSEIRKMKSD